MENHIRLSLIAQINQPLWDLERFIQILNNLY